MKIGLVKLDVSPYVLIKKDSAVGKEIQVEYSVKEALSNILYHPDLHLSIEEAINRKTISDRLEICKEDHIVLSPEDYSVIYDSFGKVLGFGKDDVELLKRIKNAERFEVDLYIS